MGALGEFGLWAIGSDLLVFLLIASIFLNFLFYFRLPYMMIDVAEFLVRKYVGRSKKEGKSPEGILGFLNTPIGEKLVDQFVTPMLGGGETGASASPAQAPKWFRR